MRLTARALSGLAALILLAAPLGCSSGDHELVIRVSGTPGTSVVGHYVLVSRGDHVQTAIQETVPFNLTLTGSGVSCYLQKLGQNGALRVQVLVDGRAVAFESTQSRFGSVTAKTP